MGTGDWESEAKQRALLRRILASTTFGHSESLQRILLFLYERTRDESALPLKEYDIALGAIHRPESFDPKTDAIVRVSIAAIREKLRAYFATEGGQELVRLVIPKGQYRVRFEEMESSRAAVAPTTSLRKFWGPYLTGAWPNVLLYTELLCFRDGHGNYFRSIYLNDPTVDPATVSPHLPGATPGEIRPSFHFVSGGEMHGSLSLAQTFQGLNVSLEVKNTRFVSWPGMRNSNLIVLGSPRTNAFLNSLQGEEGFTIGSDAILCLQPHAGEQASYHGSRSMCGKLERVVEFALVTRRPGPLGDSAITLIAANHGRAMEGAAQYVTREDKLSGLLRILGAAEDAALPAHFQVLLKVDMIDFDEEVMDVGYVTHRVIGT